MPVWKLSCSGNSIELYKHQLFVGRDDDCDITFKVSDCLFVYLSVACQQYTP